MTMSSLRAGAASLLVFMAVAGCAAATRGAASGAVQPVGPASTVLTPAEQARADGGRPPYTSADVRFMQGMIRHHAQAIVMAALAQTRAARNDVKVLAGRIDVAQRDEIATMERWLRDRRETVPGADAGHHAAGPQGHAPDDLMPGMLTPDQLTQLGQATGPEFDRLFLTFMIQHHEGALTMVTELFASPGAGQDPTIFRFASDVEADQTTEIDRMHAMLATQRNQP